MTTRCASSNNDELPVLYPAPWRRRRDRRRSWCLAVAPPALEAVGAVDRLVAARLERHPRHATARGADGLEHLPRPAGVATATTVATVAVVGRPPTAAAAGLVGRAARGAAPGLIGEALLGEEVLLAFR